MFMVSNSKLNLYTYLAQGNLYKNSNAIEQAFFFFCKAYTVHIFLSKLNILTLQHNKSCFSCLLRKTFYLEVRSFFVVF